MGQINKLKTIDLLLGPSILTEVDKKTISKAIAQYKQTGKKPARQSLKVSINSEREKANYHTEVSGNAKI